MTKVEELVSVKPDGVLEGPALALFNYALSRTRPGRRQFYMTYTAASSAGLSLSPSEYKSAAFELVAKGHLAPCKAKFKYNLLRVDRRVEPFDRSAEPDFWKAAK